jgi:hypothetical protein
MREKCQQQSMKKHRRRRRCIYLFFGDQTSIASGVVRVRVVWWFSTLNKFLFAAQICRWPPPEGGF